jgi:hypothetical protein
MPEINPSVVARPEVETVLLDSQAGIKTAGVNDPNVIRKVLFQIRYEEFFGE